MGLKKDFQLVKFRARQRPVLSSGWGSAGFHSRHPPPASRLDRLLFSPFESDKQCRWSCWPELCLLKISDTRGGGGQLEMASSLLPGTLSRRGRPLCEVGSTRLAGPGARFPPSELCSLTRCPLLSLCSRPDSSPHQASWGGAGGASGVEESPLDPGP